MTTPATIDAVLRENHICEETELGLRFATQCMYPSYDRVDVFIVDDPAGHVVHDGGGAARIAWMHGVEKPAARRHIESSAAGYECDVQDVRISVTVKDEAWLWTAIASVANASAEAAHAAVGRRHAEGQERLVVRAKHFLDQTKLGLETKREVRRPGESGKQHQFDLSVRRNGSLALINAVSSHPASIAAKFLAFSDTARRSNLYKFALHEGDLAQVDKVLLSNVADVLEFDALQRTKGEVLFH